ncbi:VCBS repeat-containing protein [bacterium]|nr:VCBS repeat-containing protein [bacterium]
MFRIVFWWQSLSIIAVFLLVFLSKSSTAAMNFNKHTITENFHGAHYLDVADLDLDGDMDVLGAAFLGNAIAWWENDGNQNFTEHIIADNFNGASDVYAIDLDSDGDVDVLGAAILDKAITWWENNGNQNFTEHIIASEFDGAHWVRAIDLDLDGDIDVLGAASYAHEISWWENDGNQNFTKHTIARNYYVASVAHPTDLDLDGDVDVLGAALLAHDISWWENNGRQRFIKHTIARDFHGASDVSATDMDGDGDGDILGSACFANKISWWENDGNQNFIKHDITEHEDFDAVSISAMDMDSDGDVDVLGAACLANKISWWENNGNQDFTEHTINDNFNLGHGVYATDLDLDGDGDVLGAAFQDDEITWWENGPPQPDIVVTPERLNYWNVKIGDGKSKILIVNNEGTDVLSVNKTIITGMNPDQFDIIVGGGSFYLEPGDSHYITVRFKPTSKGTKNASLMIISNDVDENPYFVMMRGRGVLAVETKVFQNSPNPFNPETWIPYQLSYDTNVTIKIYNIQGHIVRILRLGRKESGLYLDKQAAAYWDGRDEKDEKVASGVYFYTLQTCPDEDIGGEFSETRKMVILK